ncbi:MAG: hypothetical protein DMG06_22245, partial [Acidobacteria bacterium]
VLIPFPIRTNPKYGSRGLLSEIGSMKNPPLIWCNRECIDVKPGMPALKKPPAVAKAPVNKIRLKKIPLCVTE